MPNLVMMRKLLVLEIVEFLDRLSVVLCGAACSHKKALWARVDVDCPVP
jgi:hypothetical protein